MRLLQEYLEDKGYGDYVSEYVYDRCEVILYEGSPVRVSLMVTYSHVFGSEESEDEFIIYSIDPIAVDDRPVTFEVDRISILLSLQYIRFDRFQCEFTSKAYEELRSILLG